MDLDVSENPHDFMPKGISNVRAYFVEVVNVTGVNLSPTSTTLYVGNTATLTATVTPDNATDKNVTWSTSNADVATVANGVVTAVGAGTATITATEQQTRVMIRQRPVL